MLDVHEPISPAGLDFLLARLAEDNDEEQWTQLLIEEGGWCRALALRRLGNEAMADDCMQDFVLRLHHALRKFRRRSDAEARAWLRVILMRTADDMLRSETARHRRERIYGQDEVRQVAAARSTSSGEDKAEALHQALQGLPAGQRRVVELRFLDGMSVQEVAEELGIREGATRRRLGRALENLRMRLGKMHVTGVLVLFADLQESRLTGSDAPSRTRTTATGVTPLRPYHKTVKYLATIAVIVVTIVWGLWAAHFARGSAPGREHFGRVVAVEGEVWRLIKGVRVSITPNSAVEVGDHFRTGQDGHLLLELTTAARLQLREDSELQIEKSDLLALQRGAVVIESPQETTWLRTTRARAQVRGTARVLTTAHFCRLDLVTGNAKTAPHAADPTTGQPLQAGQAMAYGLGCISEPIPASPEELSPRFGGLLFRSAVEKFQTDGSIFGNHASLERIWQADAEAMAIWPLESLVPSLERHDFIPTFESDSQGRFLKITSSPDITYPCCINWSRPVQESGFLRLAATIEWRGKGRLGIAMIPFTEPLALCRWIKGQDLAFLPKHTDPSGAGRNRWKSYRIIAQQVGQGPNGSRVWEQCFSGLNTSSENWSDQTQLIIEIQNEIQNTLGIWITFHERGVMDIRRLGLHLSVTP